MRKFLLLLAIAVITTTVATAQSSGNFSAAVLTPSCSIDVAGNTGNLDHPCTTTDGTQCAMLTTPIKVSNGSGLALLVTPSMVTGLFTQTTINTTVPSASADIGLEVCLNVTDSNGVPVPAAKIYPNQCVTYDQRFQQLSSTLFSQLTECNIVPDPNAAGVVCPTTACPTGDTCVIPTGGTTGTCYMAGANNACDLTLLLSTLSAHSFNFIVTVPQGTYNVSAAWNVKGVVPTGGKNSNAQVEACAGPGTLTVTQTKVFNNSGSITTTP